MKFELWKPVLPSLDVILWMAPTLAIWLLASGALAGWLKLHRGLRTGDTRKLFHFSVFFLATALHAGSGPPGVNLLGCLVAIYIGYCLLRGDGNPLYEAIARESDHPRRSLHVLAPFLATAAGGILAISLFGDFAIFGFAICGIADAVAEPIGIRLGKHRYRTWNLPGCAESHRSLEGSLAVFTASFITAVLLQCTGLSPVLTTSIASSLLPAVAIAVVATFAEACSPHGTDNFTLQVAASGFAWGWQSLLPSA